MSKIIWADIDNDNISEIMLLAATFEVTMKRGIHVKIKVYEYPNGKFMPISSHAFWGPTQFSAYESNPFADSIEIALNSAIEGLTSFDREEFSNEEVFYVKEDKNDNIGLRYFDGNGYEVSHEEFLRRRKK